MRKWTRTLATVTTLALMGAGVAQAQTQSATILATATVMQPINVVGAANLAFGNVFPGVARSIAVTAAGAGRFNVTGQASAPVFVSFVLPTNLTSGGNNLPIGTWTGHRNTVNNPTTGTNFTPSGAQTAATFSGTGQLFVYVGATVTPATNQAAGNYSGTIQITVTY
jgi:spore coat protein U-like protein